MSQTIDMHCEAFDAGGLRYGSERSPEWFEQTFGFKHSKYPTLFVVRGGCVKVTELFCKLDDSRSELRKRDWNALGIMC